MKKIILGFVLLVVNSLFANDFYIGAEYGIATNSHRITGPANPSDTINADNDSDDIKFKFGYGENGDMKIQAYIASTVYDLGLYDSSNEALLEVGVELIKEFTVNEDWYPYVKAGVAIGQMDVSGYTNAQASELMLSLGGGISYNVYEDYSLQLGIDFLRRDWNSMKNLAGETRNLSDEATRIYAGVTYNF